MPGTWAKRHRDSFIQAANVRAPQLETAAGQEHTTAEIQPTEDSYEDSTYKLAPPFRRYTTDIQYEEDSIDELALSPPDYLHKDDDSQDPLGIDPPTSLTTSFGSSFDSQTRPKRALTPPSRRSYSVKRRAQPQNAVQDSGATRCSPVLQNLIRDLHSENPAEEDRPFI